MGRPRKYTGRTLKKAVREYFDGITRDIEVTERVDTGEKDSNGHAIFHTVPIFNRLGKAVTDTEYVVPPSVGALCEFLGIHRSTWAEYCDASVHPEYAEACREARERMQSWNERQLLTRPGKDIKGIMFNLQNNYGYTEKREIELGERVSRAVTAAAVPIDERRALLEELARQFSQEDTLESGAAES